MFACFMAIVISAPATNQIQDRATAARNYMKFVSLNQHVSLVFTFDHSVFKRTALHFIIFNNFFVSFYFPLRNLFEASRSGILYLNYAIIFQLYYVGLALMILYVSPNLQSANVIVGTFIILLSFCGVTSPAFLMPGFWTFMWKLSPLHTFTKNCSFVDA
ncbi:BFH_HP2_G0046960.mRNA.1.CDS.1 [Saccharomyces cerevisiae]|nr:BFH_HP2_G0046960.mRNA.1.CDS.1 [Saccharomyces cerevisiae]CAI6751046.1 BFH_HP2_G0046960.mRNA.1.CDS.1 [Saccharomyces cerevisiae]